MSQIVMRIETIMGPSWLSAEEAEEMSDEAIIDLAHEDLVSLLEGATWHVLRPEAQT